MNGGAKVLALVTDAYGGGGGIAQYNRDLLGALAAMPQVAAIDVLPRAAGDVEALPAKVRQHPARGGRIAYVAAAARQALGRRPDVIFCGHLNLAGLAAGLARRTGARLVLQLHGIEAWETPSPVQRWGAESADLVLSVSRHTRSRILSWARIAPERVAVLPNTVSEHFTPGDRAAARAKVGLGDELALLSVGRLAAAERYKGQDRVIALLPRLRAELGEAVYLIAGDGDDLPRLKALAGQSGGAEHVRFLGQASARDLPDLYRAADLFVLPSTGEGFGIVYLEAMACGTPALGLAARGAVDALADGELGDATGEDDLFEALVRRLKSPRPDAGTLSRAVTGRFGREVFDRTAAALFSRVLTAA